MKENEIQWFDLAATPSEADFRNNDVSASEVVPMDEVQSYPKATWDKTLAESSWNRR
jgi:hypothetical protein